MPKKGGLESLLIWGGGRGLGKKEGVVFLREEGWDPNAHNGHEKQPKPSLFDKMPRTLHRIWNKSFSFSIIYLAGIKNWVPPVDKCTLNIKPFISVCNMDINTTLVSQNEICMISIMVIFLTALFRNQPKVYGGAFLQK